MLVDFHGAYKPAGLRRKYPNVITREGLRGLEQSKWSDRNTLDHNVTLPFIRMVAGPMDYTPGAMINANKDNFRAVYTEPMSMGTRCHQLAMYIVYESPLQMLCDNPSNYYKEPESIEFLSAVPTVWDTTIVISARISEHITLVRKRGKEWYIGSMTNWDSRDIEIDLSFLSEGNYSIDYYQDGKNADRHAADYKRISKSVTSAEKMTIHLAPGGGWVARIVKN
jgi:alpha-glucosidase